MRKSWHPVTLPEIKCGFIFVACSNLPDYFPTLSAAIGLCERRVNDHPRLIGWAAFGGFDFVNYFQDQPTAAVTESSQILRGSFGSPQFIATPSQCAIG